MYWILVKTAKLNLSERKVRAMEAESMRDIWCVSRKFFNLIDGDSTVFEREPLEKAAQMNQLMAYKHDGYWQCMDTKREKDKLDELWNSGRAPWKVWED